jgi:hypothetical protein
MTTPISWPTAGWYPDASGAWGQRWFDGTEWTEQRQVAPPSAIRESSDGDRAQMLDRIVGDAVRHGARVESQTEFQAVVVYGKPVNHVLHAILTLFTCALWGVIWICAAAFGGEKRQVLQVDQYGCLVRSRRR